MICRAVLFSSVVFVAQLFLYLPVRTGALAEISVLTVFAAAFTAVFTLSEASSEYSSSSFIMASAIFPTVVLLIPLPPHLYAHQLYRLLFEIHMVNARDVVEFFSEQNSVLGGVN